MAWLWASATAGTAEAPLVAAPWPTGLADCAAWAAVSAGAGVAIIWASMLAKELFADSVASAASDGFCSALICWVGVNESRADMFDMGYLPGLPDAIAIPFSNGGPGADSENASGRNCPFTSSEYCPTVQV
jgi:hypothetical protein